MSTTALTVITNAYTLLNVFMPGESIPNADSATALTFANLMLGRWNLNPLTFPFTLQSTFPLVAGQGGPSNPYTIGPTGNFVVAKPATRNAITGAAIQLGATGPPMVEIPRAVVTDEAYNAIRIKELQNTQFTVVYYNPTTASGLGLIQLHPVPNTSINNLLLYIKQAQAKFVNLTAVYDLAEGVEMAITYNLARILSTIYGRTLTDEALDTTKGTLADVKRANTILPDLPIDPMFLPTSGTTRHGYDIVAGNG